MKTDTQVCIKESNELKAILEAIDDTELLFATAGSIDYVS